MIPTLEAERLVLRAFRNEDLDDYAAMSADPEVMRYIGDGKTLDRNDAWRSLATQLGHWHLRGFGMWAVTVRGDDRLVGRVGLLQPEGWPGFEIGWLLAKSAWGKGYATEAARRALRHCRDTMTQTDVISLIQPENLPSIRVAERIGERFLRAQEFRGKPVRIYGLSIDRSARIGK
jgi:RimJ/RimL family protein N-acetyltransferase